MFFSKITFRSPKDAAKTLHDEYRVHQLIWEIASSGPEQERSFLYRQVAGGIPTFYILSINSITETHPLFTIESKRFEPVIKAGDCFQFSVRVNPIVAKYHEVVPLAGSKKTRSTRHDVVMNEKFIRRAQGVECSSMQDIISTSISRWIEARAERNGFSIRADSLLFSEYTQRRFFKRRTSHAVALSTVDISGVLQVVDSDKFLFCLKNGLGPAKGFGCGLMLIRPVT